MLLQHILRSLALLRVIGLLLFLSWQLPINMSTYAQDAMVFPNTTDDANLGVDDLVYWRPDGFWALNRITLQERLVYSYIAPAQSYLSSHSTTLNRANGRIYFLEIAGEPYEFNNQGRIVEIDLATGTEFEIWRGARIRHFKLSPDGTRMLVESHHPLEAGDHYVDSVMETCILTIETGDCVDVTAALPRNIPIYWLDDTTVLYSAGTLVIANIEDLEWQPVPEVESWVFEDFVILPGRRLLCNAFRAPDRGERYFVEINLDTLEVTQLPTKPRLFGIDYLSPNEQYLIYGARAFGAGSGDQELDVLNLQSGHYFTITLTNHQHSIEWFPDSQGALAVTTLSTDQGVWQNDLVYIDLSSQEVHVLGSYHVPIFQSVHVLNQ